MNNFLLEKVLLIQYRNQVLNGGFVSMASIGRREQRYLAIPLISMIELNPWIEKD